MDLDLSEFQQLLLDSARKFLDAECPPAVVRVAIADHDGFSEPLWRKAGELGWPGLAVEERFGGSGASLFDLLLLAEELGRSLAPIPLLSSALLCAPLIQAHGSEAQRDRFLPAIALGERIAAFALTEPIARFDSAGVQMRARRDGAGWVLDGSKLFVRDGAIAHTLVVAARTGDAAEAITLFLVDGDAPGLTRKPLITIGADRQAELWFEAVHVEAGAVLGPVDAAWPLIEEVLRLGTLAECAVMAGAARVMTGRAVAYAKERVQFGRQIGSFQAISHMCADMALATEAMRYTTYLAASHHCNGRDAEREIAQAKAYVSDAGSKVAADAHQVHAGVAFIKDHDLHLWYDRMKLGDHYYGIAEHHREKVAELLLDR